MADLTTGSDFGDIFCIGILLCMSALFSGLTLGLLSRSLTELDLLISEGTPLEREQAKTIYVVRKDGYLLLSTLLVGNVCVNTLLSILMAGLTSGLVAFMASTAAIVIFGEILPQAICARHPLWVGSKTAWLVLIIRTCLYPIVYPISRFLILLLGEEEFDPYSKGQLRKLVEFHAAGHKGTLTATEKNIIAGVLDLGNKTVKDVMIPLSEVFSVDAAEKLNDSFVQKIMKTHYKKIPVYRIVESAGVKRKEYFSVLRVNDVYTNVFSATNEEERSNITVGDIVKGTGLPLPTFPGLTPVSEALSFFQKSRQGHLAIVTKNVKVTNVNETSPLNAKSPAKSAAIITDVVVDSDATESTHNNSNNNSSDSDSDSETVPFGLITLSDIISNTLQFDTSDATDLVPTTPAFKGKNKRDSNIRRDSIRTGGVGSIQDV